MPRPPLFEKAMAVAERVRRHRARRRQLEQTRARARSGAHRSRPLALDVLSRRAGRNTAELEQEDHDD